MEVNSIIKVKADDTKHEIQLKNIQLELAETEDSSHNLDAEPKHLKRNGYKSNENVKCGVTDELLFVLKSVPKENLLMIDNQLSKCKTAGKMCTGLHSGSKDMLIEESDQNIIKTEPKDKLSQGDTELDPRDMLIGDEQLNMRFKLEVKSFDLLREQAKEISTNSNLVDNVKIRTQNVSDEVKIMKFSDNPNPGGKCSKIMCNQMEIRLDKIPKDVLGNYGIIIEDCDGSSSPEGESRMSVQDDVEDEGEDGRLVIDEEEIPLNKTERTSETSIKDSNISDNETELCGVTLSAKENTSGFTNCGHHLVISSVTSLQWNKQCNICDAVLPDTSSLENHRKGHCSFPGCLDYIENDSEMEKHLQVHKAHPVKPFRCEYCKKRFHYYRFSKKHRDVCKVLKRSKCPHCKYSSSKLVQFNKHVAKHVNKMTCTDCRKSYTLVKKYSKHLYVHHRKQVLFQCTECPRRFILPENIIEHIQTHKLNISDCGLSRFIKVQSTDET